jgi:hypothetical protein
MALSKLTYNSLNVTAAASKGIGFDSDPDALQADYTGGSMTFIKKLTASSSATLSFVDGTSDVVLDNTYKEYLFTFNNIHPQTDSEEFTFQGNAAGGSGYNETITSTTFAAQHGESDSPTELSYDGTADQAQGTGFQQLSAHNDVGGAEADESLSGYLHLFNPSSTTFVKHFIAVTQYSGWESRSVNSYTAGYFNTTSAIDEIQFKMTSGNIDAGDICLYGIN